MNNYYHVFAAPGRRMLTVVEARTKADALRIARQTYRLSRKAFAVFITPEQYRAELLASL